MWDCCKFYDKNGLILIICRIFVHFLYTLTEPHNSSELLLAASRWRTRNAAELYDIDCIMNLLSYVGHSRASGVISECKSWHKAMLNLMILKQSMHLMSTGRRTPLRRMIPLLYSQKISTFTHSPTQKTNFQTFTQIPEPPIPSLTSLFLVS